MSDSLLPGIISAAIVSVNSVIAVCTPITVVPRSSAMAVTATFMLVHAYDAMNWASASGSSIERGSTAASGELLSIEPSIADALDRIALEGAGHAVASA